MPSLIWYIIHHVMPHFHSAGQFHAWLVHHGFRHLRGWKELYRLLAHHMR